MTKVSLEPPKIQITDLETTRVELSNLHVSSNDQPMNTTVMKENNPPEAGDGLILIGKPRKASSNDGTSDRSGLYENTVNAVNISASSLERENASHLNGPNDPTGELLLQKQKNKSGRRPKAVSTTIPKTLSLRDEVTQRNANAGPLTNFDNKLESRSISETKYDQNNESEIINAPTMPRSDSNPEASFMKRSETFDHPHQRNRPNTCIPPHVYQAIERFPKIMPPVKQIFTGPIEQALKSALKNPLGTTNVYVRGLQPTTTDQILLDMVSRFGKVISAKAMVDEKSKCKGFGFASFERISDSECCIIGLTACGYQCSFAKEPLKLRLRNLEDNNSSNLYLANLPRNMHEGDIKNLFYPPTVQSVRILRDENGDSKGVGFARFENRSTAEEVMRKYDGHVWQSDLPPMRIRFADSSRQKGELEFKNHTAQRREARSKEYRDAVSGIIPNYAMGGRMMIPSFDSAASPWKPQTPSHKSPITVPASAPPQKSPQGQYLELPYGMSPYPDMSYMVSYPGMVRPQFMPMMQQYSMFYGPGLPMYSGMPMMPDNVPFVPPQSAPPKMMHMQADASRPESYNIAMTSPRRSVGLNAENSGSSSENLSIDQF